MAVSGVGVQVSAIKKFPVYPGLGPYRDLFDNML